MEQNEWMKYKKLKRNDWSLVCLDNVYLKDRSISSTLICTGVIRIQQSLQMKSQYINAIPNVPFLKSKSKTILKLRKSTKIWENCITLMLNLPLSHMVTYKWDILRFHFLFLNNSNNDSLEFTNNWIDSFQCFPTNIEFIKEWWLV